MGRLRHIARIGCTTSAMPRWSCGCYFGRWRTQLPGSQDSIVCCQSLSLGIVESKLNLSPSVFALFGWILVIFLRFLYWCQCHSFNTRFLDPSRHPPSLTGPPRKWSSKKSDFKSVEKPQVISFNSTIFTTKKIHHFIQKTFQKNPPKKKNPRQQELQLIQKVKLGNPASLEFWWEYFPRLLCEHPPNVQ